MDWGALASERLYEVWTTLRNTQRVQQTKGDDFVGSNLGWNSLVYRKCEILCYK